MGLAPLLRTTLEAESVIADEAAVRGAAQADLRRRAGPLLVSSLSVLGFLALWCIFIAFDGAVPYVANGSDIVKLTKKNFEKEGVVFPPSFEGTRLAIYGNSKVLSGFIPDEFDSLAAKGHIAVYSYNSGLPAQSEFVHELEMMANRSAARPGVILLTRLWRPSPKGDRLFSLPADDNQIADDVFPFRMLARNLSRFAADSVRFGGPFNLYRREKAESDKMLNARGYYFIRGQSGYGDSLPAGYTLPTDDASRVEARDGDFAGPELKRLNEIVEKHNLRCFYVPDHLRSTEAAPAPPIDTQFATLLAQNSPCRAIGPDYFTYSPVLYADEAHLNEQGAALYTQDLYRLIAPYLRKGANAVQ
jgi:hypothetical protein